jgi:sulfide:quinone oxidoreductase
MIKAQGITTIINNRPDGEAGHPSSNSQLQAAAEALGLKYHFIPFIGMNFPPQALVQMADALDQSSGKVLAFCRTGNRSINAWAKANQAADTGVDVAALVVNTGFKLV